MNFKWVLICFCIILASISSYFSCKTNAVNSPFLNLDSNVNYVGKEQCRTCHAEHYNTFIQTGMGKSFGLLSPQKSAAFNINSTPIFSKLTGYYYQAIWRNNELFISETGNNYKREHKVKYVVGSGHHTNSHFWEDSGYLYQAPLTFYTQKKIWDVPPGFENYHSRWDRAIELECISCHNAMPNLQKGTRNKYIHLPEGIDCERCHGPGELHVKEKMAGKIIDTSKFADYTIVNPKRLPFNLQMDICQRCHLQGNNVLKPNKSFTDFRPGMRLSDVFEVYMPNLPENQFVMAGHAERFQQSACFIKSNANTQEYNPKLNFTCINCHNPHVSVKTVNNTHFNKTCLNCHSSNGRSNLKSCSAPKETLLKEQNNCISCHMPANNTKDIPHVTVHDHYIRKPNQKSTNNNKNELLHCINSTKKELHTEALISWYDKFNTDSTYLNAAKQSVGKTSIPIQIYFYFVQQQYNKITPFASKLNPQNCDVWTNYRIAKALDKENKLSQSLNWYKQAYNHYFADPQFAAEYANALIRSNQLSLASQVLSIYKVHKTNVLILYNLALLNVQLQAYSNAKQYANAALKLNPKHTLSIELLKQLGLLLPSS